MTDDGAVSLPVQDPELVPFRPRAAYAGFRAFGDGGGAVLIDPRVTRDLRLAAQSAVEQQRATGGLLYGRTWADAHGRYLVVAGFLEARPDAGTNRDAGTDLDTGTDLDGWPADGTLDGPDSFTLSTAALRRLRDDAAAAYPAEAEVGWWRTLAELGEFGYHDLETQRDLVEPGGAGLLVYGSGVHWGTAYLGPDGHAPDSAGTLTAESAPDDPETDADPDREAGPDAADTEAAYPGPGDPEDAGTLETALAVRPRGLLTPAPRPARAPVISPLGVPGREWAAGRKTAYDGPGMPGDAKLVVGVAVVAMLVAAVLIGMLMSNAIVAVIAAVLFCLVVLGFVWMSRL